MKRLPGSLLTLLVTLRVGFGHFDAVHLLNPLFVLRYFAPFAVPVAALGLAVTFQGARLRSMIMLACAAAVGSMSLTMGPWALAEARVASASTTATGVLAGHNVPASAWRGMREQLREPGLQEFVNWPLQLALLSLLLPIFGWLLVRMPGVTPIQVTALLVSTAALEPLRLWVGFRALDPSAAWGLHALLAGILVTAVTLRLRQDESVV